MFLFFTFLILHLDFFQCFKLTNYADLLQEIPNNPLTIPVEVEITNNDIDIRGKTVKELLKMNEDGYFSNPSDFNYFPSQSDLNVYDVNYVIEDIEELDVDPYDNVHIYDGDFFQPDSFENRLENMLGSDFFEDKKFILFVIFSLVIFILLLTCCIISIRWCCQSCGHGGQRSRRDQANSSLANSTVYQPITIPISYSSPSSVQFFPDSDSSLIHDEWMLKGKTLYPGVL